MTLDISNNYPIMVIKNAYDIEKYHTPNYISEIEGDVLIMCCPYGKIKSIFTTHDCNIFQGSMLVIFLEQSSAMNCAIELHNKLLHDRELKILLYMPELVSKTIDATVTMSDVDHENHQTKSDQEFDLDNFFNNLL